LKTIAEISGTLKKFDSAKKEKTLKSLFKEMSEVLDLILTKRGEDALTLIRAKSLRDKIEDFKF
jgi:hypothetical protein